MKVYRGSWGEINISSSVSLSELGVSDDQWDGVHKNKLTVEVGCFTPDDLL